MRSVRRPLETSSWASCERCVRPSACVSTLVWVSFLSLFFFSSVGSLSWSFGGETSTDRKLSTVNKTPTTGIRYLRVSVSTVCFFGSLFIRFDSCHHHRISRTESGCRSEYPSYKSEQTSRTIQDDGIPFGWLAPATTSSSAVALALVIKRTTGGA